MSVPDRAKFFIAGMIVTCALSLSWPAAAASPQLVEIEGIAVPLSKLAIRQGRAPIEHSYFVHHFPPLAAPAPYIVLVPGCGGLRSLADNTLMEYADEFVRRGYGAVVLDILRDTGIDHVCIDESGPSYMLGALSAAQFASDTGLSSGRTGIVGQSRGAVAALRLSGRVARAASIYANAPTWFDAAVAFYPWCSDTALASPMLVLIGEEDEWTPAVHCRRWLEQGRAENLDVVFYPGAHHSFDIARQPLRKMYGFRLGFHPQAAEDARRRMFEYFDAHLK